MKQIIIFSCPKLYFSNMQISIGRNVRRFEWGKFQLDPAIKQRRKIDFGDFLFFLCVFFGDFLDFSRFFEIF